MSSKLTIPRRAVPSANISVHPRRYSVVSFNATAILLLGILAIARTAGCNSALPVVVATPPAATAAAPADPATPPTPFQNSIGMWLAPVSAGEFVMGSPGDEAGHDADETQHKVRITRPFLLGVYQVTQSQYFAVMGTNPSYFRDDDLPPQSRGDLPVESVSWDEAVAFCKKLSEKESKTYRLPTEAEWEFACRAGSSGPYAGDGKLDDIGWYLGNSGRMTHPVGMLQPNDWGFYDMQGNVWEWCSDWYGAYPTGEAVDPTGPATGTWRVLRGGNLEYDLEYARCGFRNYYLPDARLYYIGFRVAADVR